MPHRNTLPRAVVPGWVALLALAICAPLFARGYVLTYDMVWVPHLDLHRSELWGLDSALPRAVPSDALVALLGGVLPSMLVQKLVLFGALVGIGLGADQLVRQRPLPARLAAVTFAVWNPLVAERLLLGQWPLLIAYAGLFWLLAALCREDGPRWGVVTIALAATALTPVTGVMGVLVGVVAAWRRGAIRVGIIAVSLNLPWIVASLLQPDPGRSDPAAVAAFDLQGEGSLGRVGSALTLGGIWNSDVVPTSRTLGIAVLFAVLTGLVVAVGMVVLFRGERRLAVVLTVIGTIGVAVALSGWLFPDLVQRVVEDVPGGGIIRDGTRWLVLLAPLEVVALGAGVCALVESSWASWKIPAALLVAVLPVAALPDLAWGGGGALRAVSYPAEWSEARDAISDSTVPGDLVSLPFSAYRAPRWNEGRTVIDPAGRYFDRTTVTNDELNVGRLTIAGEDPRAVSVRKALASSDPLLRLAQVGIGLAVVDTEAPGADEALAAMTSADELELNGTALRIFVIPGADPAPVSSGDRRWTILAWSVAGLSLALGLCGAVRKRMSRPGWTDVDTAGEERASGLA
ncbi:MAG: hypothetical protein ABIN55_12370 [Aeromicrobium sp.]